MYNSNPGQQVERPNEIVVDEGFQPPSFYIPLARPLVSRTMIGINIVVFVITVLFELFRYRTAFGPNYIEVLYLFGMKSNFDILNGEVWRLFTAMFLHIGPVHLLSNLIGLLMLGPIIEGHFGHWRFTAIYLLGGLLGSIASYAFSPALSAGASGAIFGLLGATLLYFYRFRENFGQRGRDILQSMVVVLVLNLFIGVSMNNVDNWGHVGGLVGGILMTLGVMPRYHTPETIKPGRQPLIREHHLVRDLSWTVVYIGFLIVVLWLATQAGPPLTIDLSLNHNPIFDALWLSHILEDISMDIPRSSGILLHPTSLPGPYGIGSFNKDAYEWVDLLERTRQTLWQVLPLGPTGYGDSPYQSFSTFAGNPYLISLTNLVEDGLLDQQLLENAPDFPSDRVDFGLIYNWKLPVLRSAAARFSERADPTQREDFEAFCTGNSEWLEDYALFMALKDAHDGAPWNTWAMPLRGRNAKALAEAKKRHTTVIHFHKFGQWLFYRQWEALKSYANNKGIRIVGDIPIYVAMDSADVWRDPEVFFLDEEYQPTVVAGVPPDYFSETGQLWGNPIYRWERMARNGYQWWLRRIRAALHVFDIVRIDHFRGFAGYWEVPAAEKTAVNGQWVQGPGAHFFNVVKEELGELPIIAEDLGEITPDVIELRNQFNLPGMKILQFAFSTDAADKFLPHNYKPNFVVYSGTHDNDTACGWYQNSSTEHERNHFRRYFRTDGHEVSWTLLEGAFRSVAIMALVPLQDVLSLGTDARMNLPGRAADNWGWRYQSHQIEPYMVERLKEVTLLYGRDPLLYEGKADEAGGQ